MKNTENPNDWFQTLKVAMTYTQLGLSVVTPLILSVLLAYWLQRRFALDSWVTLIGLGLGLVAMLFTLFRYLNGYIRESKKRQEALRSGEPSAESTPDEPTE